MTHNEQIWLDQLNTPQRQAVTAGNGPLLVVAGAGSGKTRTLAFRVAYLIANGVLPERILLLTFTRRAADQMLERAKSTVPTGSAKISRVWGGTFHAMANRLLRIYALPAGLSPDFTIMDTSDAQDMLNVIRHDLSLSNKPSRFPGKATCLAIYSRRMNSSEDLATILKERFPWCATWQAELSELFGQYIDRKQQQNVLDYDDLLIYWKLLLADDTIAESMGSRFEHVLVDEYQDTNQVQSDILVRLRKNNCNLMAVGDDAQSIYSFRSASIRNMLDFPKRFPATTVIKLEQNYRSVKPILHTTNRVIDHAHERYAKQLWSTRAGEHRPQLIPCKDETEQDEVIVRQVLEHLEQGIPLHKQAILFRAASHSNSLELLLTRRNIPYHKYGGLRFLEAAHIKDLVAILRIAENPRDEIAWFRVLQLLEGVGPATAALAIQHVRKHRFDPATIVCAPTPGPARRPIQQLGLLYKDLATLDGQEVALQIARIRRFYLPILERVYENPQPRADDIEHLQQLAGRSPTRQRFLTDLILDPPKSTGDLAGPPARDEDWLVLSPIHSAQGCEWDAVYLIHAADGCLPSDMATGSAEELEEERRLTYVAMTRARDFLYVTWPLRYYHKCFKRGDEHSYAQCCRFLTEDVRQTMDEVKSKLVAIPDETASTIAPRDIGAQVRSMWA